MTVFRPRRLRTGRDRPASARRRRAARADRRRQQARARPAAAEPHVLDLGASLRHSRLRAGGAGADRRRGDAARRDRGGARQARQMLAFEPPDWRGLLGSERQGADPGRRARLQSRGAAAHQGGAARDHFLGFHAVSGRGEVFKAGGQVVKNVTGYDLSKLMAGSYGTLAALTESHASRCCRGPKRRGPSCCPVSMSTKALAAMTQALNSAHELSAAAYLPAERRIRRQSDRRLARVEGPVPSVEARAAALRRELAAIRQCGYPRRRRIARALARDPRCRAARPNRPIARSGGSRWRRAQRPR